LATGALFVIATGLTVTTTSSLALSAVSLAESLKVYEPAAENAAVVDALEPDPNVTVPGPLTLVQVTVMVLPLGNPSSLAVPQRLTAAGMVMV
jgi:hypothetical protein